jgi:branched-chain amino acid transport system substrate-binding protein
MRAINRRAFVQVAGLGAAGLLAEKASALTFAGGKVGSLTAGLMLASDGSYSRMGDSFVDGFRMAMEEQGVTVSLVTRPVPRGCDGAYSIASDLLQSGVDVVVADVTTPVAKLLTPLSAKAKVPLVVANVGGHVPLPADKSPYVLHNSLLYWQASFAAGKWAAANLGRSAFVAASLADSGYDAVYAFRQGFEAAGGVVVGTQVTHVDPRSPGLPKLFDAIRASGPAFVYALYTGPLGADFVKRYASAGLAAPLVGGSLLVEDYLIDTVGGAAAKGVKSAASWTRADSSAGNQAFSDSYSRRTGRKTDPFAVLGYDTANLVVDGFQNTKRLGWGARRLVDALAGVAIDSPRGKLTVDGSTNTVTGPLSIRELQGQLGHYQNAVVANPPLVAAFPAELSALSDGATSAYFNEVLCA